jgi:hypothetical protein
MEEEVFDDDLYEDSEPNQSGENQPKSKEEENQPTTQEGEENLEPVTTPSFFVPQEPDIQNDEVFSKMFFFGSISEAITKAIKKETFLIVLLNGGNKESESLLERLKGSQEISKLFSELISLHLFTGTENFNHFIQICNFKKKIKFHRSCFYNAMYLFNFKCW